MVKRAWRILAPLLALLPLMIFAIGGAVARPLDEVMQAGTLRIAVYRDNPPSFYRDGRLVGIDVDLGRRLADQLGGARRAGCGLPAA